MEALVPGVSIFGIAGFIVVVSCITWSFYAFGTVTGMFFLLGSAAFSAIVLYFSMKSKFIEKLALKTSLEGKTELLADQLQKGAIGSAVSRIAPIGKAVFGEIETEVESVSGFIDESSKIEITSIKNNKIYVKTINP